jgi:hypothetical protein
MDEGGMEREVGEETKSSEPDIESVEVAAVPHQI